MHDFAIVGSGVSGGRIALELTEGGAKCILLEAGKAFDRKSFPPNEMAASTQMFWGGGIEISKDARFGFLRGKCLGGTSVVNQADLDRFDDFAWDHWRDRSGVPFLNARDMDPLYDELDRKVASGPIPPQYYNRNAKLFTAAFEKRGYHWQPITRSQTDCKLDQGSDCIVCLGGCPRDAKQSTLVSCIPAARAKGLSVETEFEAEQIIVGAAGVTIHGSQRGNRREVKAAKVVLAAGAFGNTALLQKSKEIAKRLPALGSSFCCHPQYMTFGYFSEPIDAHKGALQSVQAHDEKLRKAGLKLENVFAGPIATAMLLPGIRAEHHRLMRKLRYYSCIEVAVMDDPTGRITIDKTGKIIPDKRLTDADRAKIARGLEIAVDLHHAVNAEKILRCDQGFGLHLMGGCPLGVDPSRSVVGPDFRVHGHPNLFAADSSVFPMAPGINPSFTVMALSLRACKEMLKR